MKSVSDGIERYTHRNSALNASRPRIAKVREQYIGAINSRKEELGTDEIPYEDMVAIRQAIRRQNEEEKARMVRVSIFLLVAAIVIAVILVAAA